MPLVSIDPQFMAAFSETDSAKMRKIYRLAEASFPAYRPLDDGLKYKLASIIIYIFASEKRGGGSCSVDDAALASEALEVLCELPLNESIRR